MWILLLIALAQGDVYMHNPRGSNDRNCERNVNRNNGNLMFDSQNNAKGGYACPRAVAASSAQNPPNGLTKRLEFEEGSILELEWTAQHGCGVQKENEGTTEQINAIANGQQNVHCEIVLQLGCSSTLDPEALMATDNANDISNTRNGIPAVPREGIPNSDNDAATNRIGTNDPGQAKLAANSNAGNLRFGVHETPEYYNECNRVKRNAGLFTADQNVNRRSAIGTRQNPNGGRRGLECPEERDYYPYWRPAPFVDVAYLVDDASRCGAGNTAVVPCGGPKLKAGGIGGSGRNPDQVGVGVELPRCGAGNPEALRNKGDWIGNAQGVVVPNNAAGPANTQEAPGSCVLSATGKVPKQNPGGAASRLYNRREWPSNEADCQALIAAGATTVEWKPIMFAAGFGWKPNGATQGNGKRFAELAADGAVCDTIDYSRSNHLGNSGSADTASRWTMRIPPVNSENAQGAVTANQARQVGSTAAVGEACFLRMRYNMSSSDYVRELNSTFNGDASPIQQDPLVDLGNGDLAALALNTNQVARTFQDRSYTFIIKPKTSAATGDVLNVNVRGKRGNIVQVYPSVEYDYIPDVINEPETTTLAFQWVTSDYNPRRGCNDGEGGPYTGDNNVIQRLINNPNTQGSNQNSRTDRMTLLMVKEVKDNYPQKNAVGAQNVDVADYFFAQTGKTEANVKAVVSKFASADAKAQLAALPNPLNCLTAAQIDAINNENRRENHPRNCAEGNALSPYFSTEEVKLAGKAGNAFNGYSGRNNNFSNRDSKLKISVYTAATTAVTGRGLPLPIIVEPEIRTCGVEDGETLPCVTFNALENSYSTPDQIEALKEADIPGYDPVENDDYGQGAKEGCTQDMIFYSAATSIFSIFNLMIVFITLLF